jgi:hypothetical protein
MRWRPQASPTRGTPGRIPVIASRVQVLAIHWKRVWIASSAMQQERYVSCVQARTARVTTSHPRSSSTAPHRRVPVPSMCPAAASCRAGWLQRPRSGTCNSIRARFHRCAPQPAEWQSAHRNAGRLRAVPSESGEGKKGAERRVRCAKLHLQNYFCRTYTPHQFRGQRVENGPTKAGKRFGERQRPRCVTHLSKVQNPCMTSTTRPTMGSAGASPVRGEIIWTGKSIESGRSSNHPPSNSTNRSCSPPLARTAYSVR